MKKSLKDAPLTAWSCFFCYFFSFLVAWFCAVVFICFRLGQFSIRHVTGSGSGNDTILACLKAQALDKFNHILASDS